jgi:hypothetical protein
MSITSSITNDIRSYADTAIEQSKQAIEQSKQARKQAIEQAQARLNGVTEQAKQARKQAADAVSGAREQARKQAAEAVSTVREQAHKALNVDAIKAAVELYLAPAKQYRANLRELAQLSANLVEALKNDKYVGKFVASAESFNRTVAVTVQERVVKPVTSLSARSRKPAKKTTASKPAATKPAATRPAKKAPAKKAAATKAPAKKAATARKAPAKKAQS